VDSTVIVNYLEEQYPEPPLYNKETIIRDLELLDQYDKVIKYYLLNYVTYTNIY
jgi:glutathione S-transferase